MIMTRNCCEAQGKGRAKGRLRKVTQKVIYRLQTIDYPILTFPDALERILQVTVEVTVGHCRVTSKLP